VGIVLGAQIQLVKRLPRALSNLGSEVLENQRNVVRKLVNISSGKRCCTSGNDGWERGSLIASITSYTMHRRKGGDEAPFSVLRVLGKHEVLGLFSDISG